jgi:hypothetical protein
MGICEEQQLWDLPTAFFSDAWKDYRCAQATGVDAPCMWCIQLHSCSCLFGTGKGMWMNCAKFSIAVCDCCDKDWRMLENAVVVLQGSSAALHLERGCF